MRNLSLRGLDDETAKQLKGEARRRGLSVNALVIQLIRRGVGLAKPESRKPIHHDLDALAGTWNKQETTRFLKTVADFGAIDEGLWR